MTEFDPSAAAGSDSGIFGLPFSPEDAHIVILPVPFEATTSYGGGTSKGPAAVLDASRQVDLLDHRFGEVYARGIAMLDIDDDLMELSDEARKAARPIIKRGGPRKKDAPALQDVEKAGEHVRNLTREHARAMLRAGKTPAILGGDHSTPLGQIEAVAEAFPGVGVLQIDAHMDLRAAFEGFRYSHASIMWNVLREVRGVGRLVQVGIRDYCREEMDLVRESGDRCRVFFDDDVADRLARGEPFGAIAADIVQALPDVVYISMDIDGLDPSLCPHTGTPVPGGLRWREFGVLLSTLKAGGKRVVGFDLVEVSPGKDEWDANVGARALYRLCGVV